MVKQIDPRLSQEELPNIYCLAARDLLALNRPQDAMRYLEKARQIDPNRPAVAETTAQAQRMLASTPMD